MTDLHFPHYLQSWRNQEQMYGPGHQRDVRADKKWNRA